MPSDRTRAGENAAIDLYIKQFVENFIKVERPDPPDALIQYKSGIVWVEVTSVWKGEHQNEQKFFAKALNSPTSNGEIFHHNYKNGYLKNLRGRFNPF